MKMVNGFLCLFYISAVLGFNVERKLKSEQCGIQTSDNPLHRDPWVVYLEYYSHEMKKEYRCAGSLISNRHVLTAAHCVHTKRYNKLIARLGEYNDTTNVDCVEDVCAEPPIYAKVAEVTEHPNYKKLQHDLAILTLEEDIPFTDFIRPICLPDSDIPAKSTFTASGWGFLPFFGSHSSVKKHIQVPSWSKTDCDKAFKKVLPDSIICAGGEFKVDTCKGDSGGPLTMKVEKHELFGVTCAGDVHCGTKGIPGIYTNVKDHLDWILSVVGR